MDAVFHRGLKTLKVPMALFRKNRQRLSESLCGKKTPQNAYVLLKGGCTQNLYCTDREQVFRQESFFHWAFGVEEPDCYGVIEVATAKSTLFVPRLPESYGVWMGKIWGPSDFQKKYETDEVRFVDELANFFEATKSPTILLLEGQNSDSNLTTAPAKFEGLEKLSTDKSLLYSTICELRVIKTAEELSVIRYANEVSSEAHKKLMKAVRPGMKEYQLESLFLHHCYSEGGARHVCYTCISASGENSAVLHYGHAGAPNSRTLQSGDICLFDMGCEYACYCSDITCSFPVDGKFTPKQRLIYETVYKANQAVMKAVKPGVCWVEMHKLSERTMLQSLIEGGLLKGDVDRMMDKQLGHIFMPHGLGHLLGCDVHDVGGYLKDCPPRPQVPGQKSLRTARKLQENMVLTIEPGCYFIDKLLDEALEDAELKDFLVKEVIEEYRNFGGVRIEDDVVVTADGCENLTKVPRTVEEVEAWMAS